MKRLIAIVLSTALIVGLLAGCKGTVTPGTSTSISSSTSASVSAEPVKITLWGPLESYSQAEKDVWNYCLAAYKKRYPNVEVTSYFPNGTDYRQEYDKALMAGNAPTATNVLPYVDVPTRAANGTIRDISSLVENWDLKKTAGKVNDAMDVALKVKGKWYGVMDYIYIAATVFNIDTITKGGGSIATIPATWDEFTALGSKVTNQSATRYGYLLLGMEWNAWPFTPWIWSAGGEMVTPNADGTYRIAYVDEPGIDVAQLWNQMIWKYKMTQKDVLKSWNDLRDDLEAGRGAFAFGRLDHYTVDAKAKYGIPPENFGIMPIPAKSKQNTPSAIAGGTAWVFSPTATEAQIKAAWDFVQMSTYDEEFLKLRWEYENSVGAISNRIPARKDLVEVKFSYAKSWPAAWAKQTANLLTVAKMEPSCLNWNGLKAILATYMQKILLKENITREEIASLLKQAADETKKTYPGSFT